MRPRKAPRTPEISRCRSPPRSGQSQPAPSTEAPPVDEQRSTKSARAKVLGKNSQKGPPAGKRAKKERTGGGSPRRPRAFWGPGAAFWGFLGAWGAVGKKAGNGPNRTRLIEIGLRAPPGTDLRTSVRTLLAFLKNGFRATICCFGPLGGIYFLRRP